jgi:hypothetical protein
MRDNRPMGHLLLLHLLYFLLLLVDHRCLRTLRAHVLSLLLLHNTRRALLRWAGDYKAISFARVAVRASHLVSESVRRIHHARNLVLLRSSARP